MNDGIGCRISVLGCSGSGKSTLARTLAERIGGDCIELDGIFHQANWQALRVEEFRAAVSARVAADRWVCDGNYSKVRDIVWARADTLIMLDYPFTLTFYRVFGRTVSRWARREVLWNGNREVFWRHFLTRESLFLWVIQTHGKRRREAERWIADPNLADKRRFRFRHPRETAAWLAKLPPNMP